MDTTGNQFIRKDEETGEWILEDSTGKEIKRAKTLKELKDDE